MDVVDTRGNGEKVAQKLRYDDDHAVQAKNRDPRYLHLKEALKVPLEEVEAFLEFIKDKRRVPNGDCKGQALQYMALALDSLPNEQVYLKHEDGRSACQMRYVFDSNELLDQLPFLNSAMERLAGLLKSKNIPSSATQSGPPVPNYVSLCICPPVDDIDGEGNDDPKFPILEEPHSDFRIGSIATKNMPRQKIDVLDPRMPVTVVIPLQSLYIMLFRPNPQNARPILDEINMSAGDIILLSGISTYSIGYDKEELGLSYLIFYLETNEWRQLEPTTEIAEPWKDHYKFRDWVGWGYSVFYTKEDIYGKRADRIFDLPCNKVAVATTVDCGNTADDTKHHGNNDGESEDEAAMEVTVPVSSAADADDDIGTKESKPKNRGGGKAKATNKRKAAKSPKKKAKKKPKVAQQIDQSKSDDDHDDDGEGGDDDDKEENRSDISYDL